MNAITSRLAPFSIAAAGVLAVAGAAQADSRHHHAYSHLPHTHTYHGHAHGSHHSGGQAIGNAIIVGGLLLGGIALLDALSDSNDTNANVSISTHIGSSDGPVLTWTPPTHNPPVVRAANPCSRPGIHHQVPRPRPHQRGQGRPASVLLASSRRRSARADRRRTPAAAPIASALDTFGIDSTCIVKTERHGRIEKTRFFLADGRLPRVPLHWSGADEVQRINPDYLSVVHTGAASRFVVVAVRPSPSCRPARLPTPTSPTSTGWARANGSCSRTAAARRSSPSSPADISRLPRGPVSPSSHPRAPRPARSRQTGPSGFFCGWIKRVQNASACAG